MNRTLIFGHGYLGRRVADLALSSGDSVYATTRSKAKSAKIEESGAIPLVCDWTKPRTLRDLPPVDRVLVAVAYDRGGTTDRETAIVGGLENLIDALRLKQDEQQVSFCYISTTGVYHQTGGVWVDETSPTQPSREGGKSHLRAEAVLHRKLAVTGYQTLRLAGIYGPGRVPRAADVIAGRPIASPETGYLNLIHVDDAAAAVMASWQSDQSQMSPANRTYVVSDDRPVIRRDFYQHIADRSGAPSPTFIDPTVDSRVRFRSETNKRVWNRRMKRRLLTQLKFPTYRDGLADVLKQNR